MHIGRFLVSSIVALLIVLATSIKVDAAEPNHPQTLSLAQALDLVSAHHASLLAADQDILLAKADLRQAGLWPNPELSVEMEGIGGSGNYRRFKGAETKVTVSQALTTGGKTGKRKQVRRACMRATEYALADLRLRVRAQTTKFFFAVLAAQKENELARQNLDLAERFLRTVEQRVGAGKDSPIKEIQAGVLVSDQRLALQEIGASLSAARQSLAALWGSSTPRFPSVTGSYDRIVSPPTAETLLARLDTHPATQQWQAALEETQASLALAKAEALSDVTLMAGYKRMEEVGQDTAVLGVVLPLPLFHRNQGAKEKAALAMKKARTLQQQAAVHLIVALKIRYQRLVAAANQARELRDTILPQVEKAYASSVTAYEQGKFDYLEVLETQRSLFATQTRYLQALRRYHNSQAELEEIAGPTHEANTNK